MAELTLKICSNKASTASGIASVLFKIPDGGRYIDGGEAWFGSHHADDKAEIYITDEDNLLGYGAGVVVGSYTDDAVTGYQQSGWFFGPDGLLKCNALAGFGVPPAGFYLKVTGTKGDLSSDTLYVNIRWGQEE